MSFAWMGLQAATISGFVTRSESNEPLQYANLRIAELRIGTQSNRQGYYVITINQPGTYTLEVSLVSYGSKSYRFTVNDTSDNLSHNFSLDKSGIELGRVRVTGSAESDNNSVNIPVSVIRRTTEELKDIVSVAEADVFRSLITLPGVTPVSDFSAGLYVRGGSPDQNLILIDDTDVYNPNHFGGIFSTFNTDAIDSAELIKGAYPAMYGGRLSSVLDVANRQGNRRYHQGIARLSLISSSLTLEGPWKVGSQNGSYMGSFRRTYVELLQQLIDDIPDYYFYDGHAKLNWDMDSRNQFTVSTYFGQDKLKINFGDTIYADWGNQTFSAQWRHIFNPKLYSRFILAGSRFGSELSQVSPEGEPIFTRINGIDDVTGKGTLSWMPSNEHQVDAGFEIKYNDTWLNSDTSYNYDPNSLPDIDIRSLMSSIFIQDSWNPDAIWTVQPGLRLTWYQSLKLNLPSLPKASYLSFDPRISVRRRLDLNESVYVSFGRFHQFLTLMSMGTGSPFDVWFPLDGSLNPGVSNHYILGYTRDFEPGIGFDLELYYKSYDKILEFNEATNYNWDSQNGTLSDTFHVGKGYTWGADLLIRNDWQGLTGFVGYTLSRTQRKMEGLNLDPETGESRYFFPRYDRTHSLNVVETYNISENTGWTPLGAELKIGTNFTYLTGQPDQVPEHFYFDGNNFQIIYSYQDRVRLPHYLRWDFSTKLLFTNSWGTIEPYLEFINVTNRDNVGGRSYYVSLDDNGDPTLVTRDSAQFPFIPFIGVNVTW
jgi:hypothetical protein